MRMYGKEYENLKESYEQSLRNKKERTESEKSQEALEGKRDDVYPCREDVPADLWGKPIPKNKMPFKTPAQDLLNTGQIKDWDNVNTDTDLFSGKYEDNNPRFHMATGAGYDDFHPELSEENKKDIDEYKDNNPLKIETDHPNYKFNEADIIDQIQEYIDSTYDGHYNRDKFQATEFILDGGHGTGFCIGNILKYAQRYGKKGTPDDSRKDLLKVIHYAIIALYNHDLNK